METRLTPDQKIPGSIPGKLAFLLLFKSTLSIHSIHHHQKAK